MPMNSIDDGSVLNFIRNFVTKNSRDGALKTRLRKLIVEYINDNKQQRLSTASVFLSINRLERSGHIYRDSDGNYNINDNYQPSEINSNRTKNSIRDWVLGDTEGSEIKYRPGHSGRPGDAPLENYVDTRTPSERDRDKILFAEEFRRLAGVTQVVSSQDHGFHNRLTHSIEVSQVGLRLAERLIRSIPELEAPNDTTANNFPRPTLEHENTVTIGSDAASQLATKPARDWFNLIDPNVVEAACLAHDMGHPPFGHAGEEELDRLAKLYSAQGEDWDGFEGNAQTFRIVSRLAIQRSQPSGASRKDQGLRLTRATLRSILKYPWLHNTESIAKSSRKYGAYKDDEFAFLFAMNASKVEDITSHRSLEAQIMDHADDIAYAVHDIFDFYRAGIIPLQDVINDDGTKALYFLHNNLSYDIMWNDLNLNERQPRHGFKGSHDEVFMAQVDKIIRDFMSEFPIFSAYQGSFDGRFQLAELNSNLINRYMNNPYVDVAQPHYKLIVPLTDLVEISFLKQLIFYYVIERRQLATQQFGMKTAIRYLFETYFEALGGTKHDKDNLRHFNRSEIQHSLIPQYFEPYVHEIESLHKFLGSQANNIKQEEIIAKNKELLRKRIRLTLDIVASFSDNQALLLLKRVRGIDPGAITDFAGQ